MYCVSHLCTFHIQQTYYTGLMCSETWQFQIQKEKILLMYNQLQHLEKKITYCLENF